jgi:hypothetical protein
VEIKAIEPPPSIRDSMEKQMRAERERRATILNAEGHKQAAILTAEGEKQSQVLRADGDRQARILQAEGQAKAIRTVFDAIHTANPSQKVLAYQYLQALPQIASGSANKVWIVPTELSRALDGLGGALGGLANMVGDKPTERVDSGAVEREAAEAASAAQAEAEAVNEQVRVAEAQVSGDNGPKGLPAPEPIPPSAALGGADYNGVAQQERA